MNSRWKRYRDVLLMLLSVAVCYGFFSLLGVSCPLKWLFGLSCPGCGMTRASLAAIRLDFSAAFYYHPLWPLLLPLGGWMLWLYGEARTRLLNVTLWCAVAVLILVYLLRLFLLSQDVVYFHPEEGVVTRLLGRTLGWYP